VGSIAGLTEVDVDVADKDGNVVASFFGVSIGQSVTIPLSAFGNKFPSETQVTLYDPLEARKSATAQGLTDEEFLAQCQGVACSRFHTSCSQPLHVNDQFGNLLVSDFINSDGVTVNTCNAVAQPGCDVCEDGAKIASLTLLFSDAFALVHGQDPDKVTVVGDAAYLGTVNIAVADKDGNQVTSFAGVSINSSVTIPASAFGSTKFPSEIQLALNSARRGRSPNQNFAANCQSASCVRFHTSCSHPVNVGNQFGNMVIEDFINTDGGTAAACNGQSLSPRCELCDDGDKITSLTIQYSADFWLRHAQDDNKVSATGNLNGAQCPPVGWTCSWPPPDSTPCCSAAGYLGASDSHCTNGGINWLDTGCGTPHGSVVDIDVADKDGNVVAVYNNIAVGETITIPASAFGSSRFPSEVQFTLYDVAGARKKESDDDASFRAQCIENGGDSCVRFHTSCSQPLSVEDQFGHIKVFDFVSEDGRTREGSCPAPFVMFESCAPTAPPTSSPTPCLVPDDFPPNCPEILRAVACDDATVSTVCPRFCSPECAIGAPGCFYPADPPGCSTIPRDHACTASPWAAQINALCPAECDECPSPPSPPPPCAEEPDPPVCDLVIPAVACDNTLVSSACPYSCAFECYADMPGCGLPMDSALCIDLVKQHSCDDPQWGPSIRNNCWDFCDHCPDATTTPTTTVTTRETTTSQTTTATTRETTTSQTTTATTRETTTSQTTTPTTRATTTTSQTTTPEETTTTQTTTATGGGTNAPQPIGYQTVLRINSGGATVQDLAGNTWQGDAQYVTGGNSATIIPSDFISVSLQFPASGPDADLSDYTAIYVTERTAPGTGGIIDYTLPATAGKTYRIRFLLAEVWHQARDLRVFDIEVDFGVTFDDLDMVAEEGFQTAFSRTDDVVVARGPVISVRLRGVGAPEGPAIYGIILEEAIYA